MTGRMSISVITDQSARLLVGRHQSSHFPKRMFLHLAGNADPAGIHFRLLLFLVLVSPVPACHLCLTHPVSSSTVTMCHNVFLVQYITDTCTRIQRREGKEESERHVSLFASSKITCLSRVKFFSSLTFLWCVFLCKRLLHVEMHTSQLLMPSPGDKEMSVKGEKGEAGDTSSHVRERVRERERERESEKGNNMLWHDRQALTAVLKSLSSFCGRVSCAQNGCACRSREEEQKYAKMDRMLSFCRNWCLTSLPVCVFCCRLKSFSSFSSFFPFSRSATLFLSHAPVYDVPVSKGRHCTFHFCSRNLITLSQKPLSSVTWVLPLIFADLLSLSLSAPRFRTSVPSFTFASLAFDFVIYALATCSVSVSWCTRFCTDDFSISGLETKEKRIDVRTEKQQVCFTQEKAVDGWSPSSLFSSSFSSEFLLISEMNDFTWRKWILYSFFPLCLIVSLSLLFLAAKINWTEDWILMIFD